MTDAEIIAANTTDAYMADAYGPERWTRNIKELLNAGYNAKAVEWIMRSKVARWADDMDQSILSYIRQRVGDVVLRNWMRAGGI